MLNIAEEKEMKVHPFAERFPMLPQDQLQDLADDIAAHGQVYPIMVDADGMLLDGRNRLAACKLAGVEPKIETWSGDRPEDYILSVNVHRRHISKGAQAMAIALVHQEATHKGGRGKKNPVTELLGLQQQVKLSRSIIREFGEDSAEVKAVMAGQSLNDTYEKGREQKRLIEELEKLQEDRRRELEQLLKEYPDLDFVLPPDTTEREGISGIHAITKRLGAPGLMVEQHKLQDALMKRLVAIFQQLEEIGKEEPHLGTRYPELYVSLLQGMNRRIAESAFANVARHKDALKTRSTIRQVK